VSTDLTNRLGVAIAAAAFEAVGYAFREQSTSDFGIDAHAERRDGAGGTGELLALQIKSGPSHFRERAAGGWWLRTDPDHADYWVNHALPVVVVMVDIDSRRVYWQEVSSATVVFAGTGVKLLVPESQQVDATGSSKLLDLLSPVRGLGQPVAKGSGCRVFLGRGTSGRDGWHAFADLLVRQLGECEITGWDVVVEVRTAHETDVLTGTNEWGEDGDALASIVVDSDRQMATYVVSPEAADEMARLWDEELRAEAAADAIVMHLAVAEGMLNNEADEDDEDDEDDDL
jgi:hypothetical protein